MSTPYETRISFTGEGGVKVKEFLRWMESWFAMMGDDFDGATPKSRAMRVAQLHVACPIPSAAGRFIHGLERDVLWDEERLKGALVDRFHDAEREDQAEEDILTTMSTLSQGDRDVFEYSRKVIKLLHRKPSGSHHYDRILTGYYLDGLASQRLRELGTLSFRRRDSQETPVEVVKGVMRLATQLRVKGYRKHSGGHCDDEDDDGSDDSEDSEDSDAPGSDLDDDDSGYYDRRKKKARRVARKKVSSKRKEGGSKSKAGRNRKGHSDERAASGEVQELREMLRDLMQLQKVNTASGARVEAARPEEDVIPLETYAVGEGYMRYPYGQQDTSHLTVRRMEYPSRGSQALRSAGFGQGDRGTDLAVPDGTYRETGRMGQPTRSYFDDSTRRVMGDTHFTRPGGQLASNGALDPLSGTVSQLQPIVGPNGVLYYPSRPRRCFYCREEGHLRSHCPRLRSFVPRTSNLGPEHPDIPVESRGEASVQPRDRPVNVVEVVTRSSALEGVKVRDISAATIEESADLRQFLQPIEEVEDSDCVEPSEASRADAAPVMAGERARRYSELPREFDGEEGPATQRQKTYENDDGIETDRGEKGTKVAGSRLSHKPIRLMAGHKGFDFVDAFREAPVTGLSWGSLFDLAPSVKRDICHLLVQERAKKVTKAKGKGKDMASKAVGEGRGRPGEEDVLAVATDRGLGDIANFYTKGTIHTEGGSYHIVRILVDAGSVVNLMPIRLLCFIGARLRKAGGMVIRTATSALAKIGYCADVRIVIAGVSCDLCVYALPEEYTPTYPLLLSRRWLQAVKAKGDYGTGQYYIMHHHGDRVRIPKDEGAEMRPRRHRPRVPLVMRDRDTDQRELSAEIEEELEWQQSGGGQFFQDLVELVKKQAEEQIKYEDEEEGGSSAHETEN